MNKPNLSHPPSRNRPRKAFEKPMAGILIFTFISLSATRISLSATQAPAAAPASDPRLVRAKVECASGNVPAGIRILAEVYAETNFKVLVYNQGRCYEQNNLREQAIARFEEFLRIDNSLTPEDIANIRKRINALKAAIDENAKLSPPNAEKEPVPRPAPIETQRISLVETPPIPEPKETPPAYKRWWFWTGIAALVAGGVATAVILSNKRSTSLDCDKGVKCILPN